MAIALAKPDPRDAEIERLRDRVEQLEEILGMRDIAPFPGMTPQSARFLGMLLKREFLSWEGANLMLAPESTSSKGNYAKVYVWKLRKWLGPERSLIQTRWGTGVFIAAKDKQRVREIITERASQ
jgi:hypothetical protein